MGKRYWSTRPLNKRPKTMADRTPIGILVQGLIVFCLFFGIIVWPFWSTETKRFNFRKYKTIITGMASNWIQTSKAFWEFSGFSWDWRWGKTEYPVLDTGKDSAIPPAIPSMNTSNQAVLPPSIFLQLFLSYHIMAEEKEALFMELLIFSVRVSKLFLDLSRASNFLHPSQDQGDKDSNGGDSSIIQVNVRQMEKLF